MKCTEKNFLDIFLFGGLFDEPEEWDGRSESWENAAQEVGRQLEWRQLFLFTWQVTRETLSSRAGQPNIFQFFFWLHCLIEILLLLGNKNGGTPALLLPDDKGRRRGGEQPEQAELRGGWRCEGGGDFSSRMPGDDCNQFALYAIGWRLDLFSETYTFNCSREERESDQVNLADRGTVLGDFLVYNVTTFTFICC